MSQKKLIIFDLDGTLYRLVGGAFKNSDLQVRILENVIDFVEKKLSVNRKRANTIILDIRKRYGENISIGLEKEYSVDRYEYFDMVWDVDPIGLIEKYQDLENLLKKLNHSYDFLLTSDAPLVWIRRVLKELGIERFFESRIMSGEGDKRKIFGNRFRDILSTYKLPPGGVISIGDQEETDILPAKMIGIKTIHVNKNKKAVSADINIKDLSNLDEAVAYLFGDEKKNSQLNNALDNLGITDRYKIRVLNGSSLATTFRYGNWIYKTGKSNIILDELNTYRKFKEKMGSKFHRTFPDYGIVFDRNGIALCRFKVVGEKNLEDFLLDSKLVNGQDLLRINDAVLSKIDYIYDFSREPFAHDTNNFFDELLDAMIKNVKMAELMSIEMSVFLKKLSKQRKVFLGNFLPSLSHRDLSAGNIIIDDSCKNVFFIDPKNALPYCNKSSSLGNVGVDLTGYYVTILRKEKERERAGLKGFSGKIRGRIQDRIAFYVDNGAFSSEIVDLFLMYWYSVYLACKCPYCTSDERAWLYEEMLHAFWSHKEKVERSLQQSK